MIPRNSTFPPKLLTVQEAAEILGLSTRTVWALLDRGELVRIRLGPRATRVASADLDEYIKRSTERGGAR